VISGPLSASLRAERSGTGTGRIYTLTIRCRDAAGNAATGTTTVVVPVGRATLAIVSAEVLPDYERRLMTVPDPIAADRAASDAPRSFRFNDRSTREVTGNSRAAVAISPSEILPKCCRSAF
jgi:hypothetical protein